jgi:DNA repair protein RadD
MIWEHWPQRELEQELSTELLGRLEIVVPKLTGDGEDPTELYLRKNLVRLVAAFAPSDVFNRPEYMRKCLNRLPPNKLEEVSMRTGVGIAAGSFERRVDTLVAQRWSDSFARAFVDVFGLPRHFLPETRAKRTDSRKFLPPSPQNPLIAEAPYKPLKDYQSQVLYAAAVELGPPRARLIIQMPTGAGKTRTAMELLTQFFRESGAGTAVVWLAHSEELCEQAFVAFGEVWQHVANAELRAYRAWGHHPLPDLDNANAFVVTSFQKLHSAVRRNSPRASSMRRHVSLIVVDEAHKAIAPTYRAAIRAVTNDQTRVVGLTATPGRTFREETEELAEFFFRTLVGIQPPAGVSVIRYLREKKVLARASYDPLETSRTYTLTDSERRTLEERFDFPVGFLKRVGADDVRNLEIMKKLIQECESSKRVLLFAASVDQSKFFAALLLYLGYNAGHVDGQTSKQRRREVIDEFRSGRVQVLCNYGVLSTGFDAPNTDVVLIARPTASPVLYSQMIGRGLRGPAIGGTDTCKLIDVIDNIVGFGNQDRVYDLFNEYFD